MVVPTPFAIFRLENFSGAPDRDSTILFPAPENVRGDRASGPNAFTTTRSWL